MIQIKHYVFRLPHDTCYSSGLFHTCEYSCHFSHLHILAHLHVNPLRVSVLMLALFHCFLSEQSA